MQKFFEQGIFSFCMHEKNVFSGRSRIELGGRYFFSDEATPVQRSARGSRELLIFGYAVDVRTGNFEGLSEELLASAASLNDVIEKEKYLGGKYLIFYRDGSELYALPDATASIPLFYSVGREERVCSSVCEYIAEYFDLEEDKTLKKIRKSSDISQAMPYDLTVYKEVKQLLPNHYYSFGEGKAIRFINSSTAQKKITAKEAALATEGCIKNITEFYSKQFKLYCPITAGRDSRVVLAFLRRTLSDEKMRCYTIKHKEHTGEEQDLVIPMELCGKLGLGYEQMKDAELPLELAERMDSILGRGKYSRRTLTIANTVLEGCGDGAIINGDIIGQIGKCSLHRDIPSFLATAGYFRCKLHNYSRGSKKALSEWLAEIKKSEEKVSSFDLFSVENRMGRWAAQENIIYNLAGQRYFNIFNSRSIIYKWTSVDRGERKRSLIHLGLIGLVDKALLEFPFEKETSLLASLSKANGIFYYLFGYLKYYVQGFIFKLRNR